MPRWPEVTPTPSPPAEHQHRSVSPGSQQSRHRARSARRDDGVSTVEYAILIGFIAAVAVVAVFRLGQVVELLYQAGRGAFD